MWVLALQYHGGMDKPKAKRFPAGRGLAVAPQQMPPKLAARAAAAAAAQLAVSPRAKPPTDWRSGDPGRTYSPPGRKRSPGRPGDGLGGAVYPAWWGDGAEWSSDGEGAAPGRSRSAPRPGRRPPRLAYSVQLEPGQPIWQNDLVTARYLDVPSSGYSRAHSPPHVPPQYLPPPPGQLQQPHQPQPVQGYGFPPQPPGAPQPYGVNGGEGPQLYVVHPSGAWMPPIRTVQSRIREQVEADRAAARARGAARQRAVEAAVAAGGGAALATAQKQQYRPASAASGRSSSGPATVADSLAANPYTSWFFGEQPDSHHEPHRERQEPEPGAGAARPATPASAPAQAEQHYPSPMHPPHHAPYGAGAGLASTFLTGGDSGRWSGVAGTPHATLRPSQQFPAWAQAAGPYPGPLGPPYSAHQGPAATGVPYPGNSHPWLQDLAAQGPAGTRVDACVADPIAAAGDAVMGIGQRGKWPSEPPRA
ncbi:hypothetical protein GPECTOR_92g612 [Gonium pectorale]|uniref:Uncharacterized protein n=1 Tax=Gonium pectorale TaxID=33097 RepID=A0A150G0K9_GONPE|nr:hypothetical protein GPECTOR_92g612 [Gonium pectorale]|eukprot:KXZ43389.1 hypothetical protein GPECTOR_92g612 [Gonium pectorale]